MTKSCLCGYQTKSTTATPTIERVKAECIVPCLPLSAFAVLYDIEKRKVWFWVQ